MFYVDVKFETQNNETLINREIIEPFGVKTYAYKECTELPIKYTLIYENLKIWNKT